MSALLGLNKYISIKPDTVNLKPLEVVSKPSIRFKVKAGGGIQCSNIFNISSIESLPPTQKLGLRGGFETTSGQF